MRDALEGAGYELIIEAQEQVVSIEQNRLKQTTRRTILAWAFTLLTMSVTMGWVNVGDANATGQVAFLLSLACLIFCARPFYVSAVKQALHGSAGMDTLVALSTFISFIFSSFNTFGGDSFWAAHGLEANIWYESVVMIIAFVLTGRLLEERAKRSTTSAIRSMMSLQPRTARIVDDKGAENEVPISTIVEDDIVCIKAGDKIPVDGLLTEGSASVDESMMTGESVDVEKVVGSRVLAGTIVRSGNARIRATETGSKTALAGMIRMVEEAQNSKAPVQREVDKIALVFVPIVLLLSVLTFVVWLIFGGTEMLPRAILSAVTVLVIACPCAMGLATPTAITVGIGRAAKKGILIKDAVALEKMRQIDALVIDKTGTITTSSPEGETLKPSAKEAITDLKNSGIEIIMMSGDTEERASHWAKEAGIENYKSRVTPQDKQDMVRALQQQNRTVAMVGDGINDSQALASADVSIAIGQGTDIAMEIAQATLMTPNLTAINEGIQTSRLTVKTIHQNLFWAFIYNIICIPLAAGLPYLFGSDFIVTPMLASALMAFSSVSVVLNSLRIKYKR